MEMRKWSDTAKFTEWVRHCPHAKGLQEADAEKTHHFQAMGMPSFFPLWGDPWGSWEGTNRDQEEKNWELWPVTEA